MVNDATVTLTLTPEQAETLMSMLEYEVTLPDATMADVRDDLTDVLDRLRAATMEQE